MTADTQPIMIPQLLQLLDVSRELLLQKVEAVTDVLAEIVGKRADLPARFLSDQQSIGTNQFTTLRKRNYRAAAEFIS